MNIFEIGKEFLIGGNLEYVWEWLHTFFALISLGFVITGLCHHSYQDACQHVLDHHYPLEKRMIGGRNCRKGVEILLSGSRKISDGNLLQRFVGECRYSYLSQYGDPNPSICDSFAAFNSVQPRVTSL